MNKCMKLAVSLLFLAFSAAGAMSQSANKKAIEPAIEFGHEGGNLKPYKIAIFEDGRVEVIEGSPRLRSQSISSDKVKELAAKASRKDFWKGSKIETRPSLPDFGFVFVKVRTADGKMINHHGAQSGRLGEFYSELSDLLLETP